MALDFPNLGKHCAVKLCNQHDFLPFKCEECKIAFCQEHRLPVDHNCKYLDRVLKRDKTALVCKHCAMPYSSLLGHVCAKSKTKFPCNYPRCKATGFVVESSLRFCSTCDAKYCIKHRHHEKLHEQMRKRSDSSSSNSSASSCQNEAMRERSNPMLQAALHRLMAK